LNKFIEGVNDGKNKITFQWDDNDVCFVLDRHAD
jgi:hypothetical protein